MPAQLKLSWHLPPPPPASGLHDGVLADIEMRWVVWVLPLHPPPAPPPIAMQVVYMMVCWQTLRRGGWTSTSPSPPLRPPVCGIRLVKGDHYCYFSFDESTCWLRWALKKLKSVLGLIVPVKNWRQERSSKCSWTDSASEKLKTRTFAEENDTNCLKRIFFFSWLPSLPLLLKRHDCQAKPSVYLNEAKPVWVIHTQRHIDFFSHVLNFGRKLR